jgi:hypothetical protein
MSLINGDPGVPMSHKRWGEDGGRDLGQGEEATEKQPRDQIHPKADLIHGMHTRINLDTDQIRVGGEGTPTIDGGSGWRESCRSEEG